jgi:hypothetical protein
MRSESQRAIATLMFIIGMKLDRFLKYEVGDDFFFYAGIAAGVPIFVLDLSYCTRISYVPGDAFCRRIEISAVRIFALTDNIGQGFASLEESPPVAS